MIVFHVQQIATGPLTKELMVQMQPLHTLDDVEALLKANKLAFAWRETDMTSTQVAPEVLKQMLALPPREVFVAPQGQNWVISVILDQRPATADPGP